MRTLTETHAFTLNEHISMGRGGKNDTEHIMLRGLGHPSGQFGFVASTGQLAVLDTDHLMRPDPKYVRTPTALPDLGHDFALAYSNSIIMPLLRRHWQGATKLHEEILARHTALKRGRPIGTVCAVRSVPCVCRRHLAILPLPAPSCAQVLLL